VDDTFLHDTAARTGGGVTNFTGTVTMTDVTFSTDSAGFEGGAFANYGTATVMNATFAGDRSTTEGGAIDNGGKATITNVTFYGDSALTGCGAVENDYLATMTDVTFYEDTTTPTGPGGGAIWNEIGAATVTASVFDASSCLGTGLSGSFNVVSPTTGCGSFRSTRTARTLGITGTLEKTATYPTAPPTLALLPSSPAIGEVPRPACNVTTDERGAPRPAPGLSNCDAGAYEGAMAPPFAVSTTVPCIPDTHACQPGVARPQRPLTVSSEKVDVTTEGRGTLDVGTYGKDPAGALGGSTGKFFGIAISDISKFPSLVVTDCNLGGGTGLEWWNGHAWLPVTGKTTVARGCLTVTLGTTSSPSLSTIAHSSRVLRFQAVVFGVTKH
jgi:hypothetical protein